MKFLSVGVLGALLIVSAGFAMNRTGEVEAEQAAFQGCPTGTVTIQGCVYEVDGCYYVNTINGRIININLFNYGHVNAGDEIEATGRFSTDADCSNCQLNPSSVSVLGTCP